MSGMKIYIAGPYTPKTDNVHDAPRIAHQNVRKAIIAALKLIKKGHYPFVPHLSHFMHLENDEPTESSYWVDYDLKWLEACDAILLLPGWEESSGARREYEEAKKLGLKVYFSVDEVPDA